jgi:hypothetical protein
MTADDLKKKKKLKKKKLPVVCKIKLASCHGA